ncbi:LysR family transcriptional regulator [Ktedonosporobacter rubrisoli]|uniref:LysR family transcriptional regulator n=1 Tax=Ktedonosporobacter rubrisoli TaxID=2509675 RepID=A0A4P6JL02_KTERU|nr:LysR family transcriptional regulator [Ktedonosporobacter rubrisoli]QBD75868.1 LysR family transcriptional regulator [Ktedonosporobacter rubrisoli]
MNLHHLWIFYHVAHTQHITRAAEELYMSQPAVSQHMRTLEKELKQALLVRMGNKIYLTEAGKQLAEYAGRIFALVEDAEQAMQEFHGLQRGTLRIGASTTPGTYLLPRFLAAFQLRYPQIALNVTMKNTELIAELVSQYQLDLGFVAGEVVRAEIEQKKWQDDQLVFVGPLTKPLPSPCSIEQLQQLPLPLLLREKGSGTRAIIEQYFQHCGTTLPDVYIELNSAEMLKQAVIAGLGYAFIPQAALGSELQARQLELIPLAEGMPRRTLYSIFPREKQLSRAAQAFLDLLEEQPGKGNA